MNKHIIADTMSITDLPIDQLAETYKNDKTPCCIGARLAGYFEIESGYYLEGIDEFAKRLGGNRAHVILMLREAGAGYDPLSADDWDNSLKSVWQNLLEIEELPSLSGADLRGVNLRGADLRNTDFSGADFSYANLTFTDLRFSNLKDVNLHRVNLRDTKLDTDTSLE